MDWQLKKQFDQLEERLERIEGKIDRILDFVSPPPLPRRISHSTEVSPLNTLLSKYSLDTETAFNIINALHDRDDERAIQFLLLGNEELSWKEAKATIDELKRLLN